MYLYSKPHEISDFEQELDKDADGQGFRKKEKNNVTDDEGIKDTLSRTTPGRVALKMK